MSNINKFKELVDGLKYAKLEAQKLKAAQESKKIATKSVVDYLKRQLKWRLK